MGMDCSGILIWGVPWNRYEYGDCFGLEKYDDEDEGFYSLENELDIIIFQCGYEDSYTYIITSDGLWLNAEWSETIDIEEALLGEKNINKINKAKIKLQDSLDSLGIETEPKWYLTSKYW